MHMLDVADHVCPKLLEMPVRCRQIGGHKGADRMRRRLEHEVWVGRMSIQRDPRPVTGSVEGVVIPGEFIFLERKTKGSAVPRGRLPEIPDMQEDAVNVVEERSADGHWSTVPADGRWSWTP